ncbi:MAG: HPr family phosphocarrier protein [Gammaproteobacteria bacterium]|nr:HPr family phosphocarrier protein [Gammaproteobacteria bacterium]
MSQHPVTIRNVLGLHARAANLLAREAASFESEVQLEDPVSGRRVDAKSIMQLLMLAAGQGSALILHLEGSDAEVAAAVLVPLIDSGFGEPC